MILKWNSFDNLSEGLSYHIKNNVPLSEPIWRVGSENWFSLMNEAKTYYKMGISFGIDDDILETDIGETGIWEGVEVYLDIPHPDDTGWAIVNEADYRGKEVSLNKPFRSSGPKKYAVYVKDPKTGNVKKVNFGDAKGGLRAKINDPKARRAYSKRAQCELKKDKTTPGYWSCRLPRYAKLLGLKGNFSGYW
jgi:hypothetical protein